MSSVKSIIGRKAVTSLYYLFRIFPIKKNKIFVKNFYGRGYGDSPKYVVDYILNHYKGHDVVWCVNADYVFPDGIRTVNITSYKGLLKSIYEQVTAKVWIDNASKYYFERKRKGQYYIQTYHGDMGVKKNVGDVKDFPVDEMKSVKHDSQMADLYVCGNEWMVQRYREAYWYDGEVATCGLPRRDILYSATEDNINEIRKSLNIPSDAKLLLYVPTFRDENLFRHNIGSYAISFDWNVVLDAMKQRFGGEWYGLMRLHPNAAKYSKDLVLGDKVFNVTEYPDVDELYCISDSCISDYSSSLFEFAVTKKPGFIYAPDKDNYAGERGYYFTDEQLPFTVATDINRLVSDIVSYDDAKYQKRHNYFYNDLLHIVNEGHASEYLAKRIVEVCK